MYLFQRFDCHLTLNSIGGAKNSHELYLLYMRLILLPVKF